MTLDGVIDPAAQITMEGTTALPVSFEPALESGEYVMYLVIRDDYAPEDLHPLQQKFHDTQRYFLEFSIA